MSVQATTKAPACNTSGIARCHKRHLHDTLARMAARAARTLRICIGDITKHHADAIVTSANAGLIGNKTPTYWRFRVKSGRSDTTTRVGFTGLTGESSEPFANIDGQIHSAAGPELQAALDQIAQQRYVRMSGGGGGVWRGSLLPRVTEWLVACPAGSAVRTPAFGGLRSYTSWIIHAVAPDGRYGRTNNLSTADAEPILGETYASTIAQANEAGARSLAIPSIGCGVNNWPASKAARAAIDAIAEWSSREADAGPLEQIDIVLRSAADVGVWRESAVERLGAPMRTEPSGVDVWPVTS